MCNLKLVFSVILVLFAAGLLVAPSSGEMDPRTLVGLWLLDEIEGDKVRDSSGNGHDGTLIGSPELVAGKFGNALSFDGTDDVVDCGNADSLNLGTFTVVFWANVPETQAWNHMV